MRVLAVDVETTGLDPKTDRVTELGWVLWDTATARPVLMGGGLHRFVDPPEIPLKVQRMNGITIELCQELGRPIGSMLEGLDIVSKRASYVVAHNAPFDRSMIEAERARLDHPFTTFDTLQWIDTVVDLPLGEEVMHRDLIRLAHHHRISNPFSHRALFDALTTCLVLQEYPLDEVLKRAASPSVVAQAVVSFEERELAKDRGFTWDAPAKRWIRTVKELDIPALQADAPFQLRFLKAAA